jgi:hypothetical protein
MITKERIEKTKAKLLREAKQINEHIALMKKLSESDFLDRNNGKKVNARFHAPMARAMGCEEKEYDGKPWFPNTEFTFSYMPAPLSGRSDVPQLKMKVCEGWGQFEIPLICDWDNGYLLDAAKTREAWEKVMELRQKWADHRAAAVTKVSAAAKAYNKIEAAAVKLAEVDLQGAGPDGFEITVLCAFGGDIYDRINPFRWHEQNAEVK